MKKRITALILSALMIVSMIPIYAITSSADNIHTGSCGPNLNWSFNENTGALILSGYGEMNNFPIYYFIPWYAYRDQILTVTIPQGVTSIGSCAFQDCTALTTLKVPKGVTTIGHTAFMGSSLSSIYIPSSVTSVIEEQQ